MSIMQNPQKPQNSTEEQEKLAGRTNRVLDEAGKEFSGKQLEKDAGTVGKWTGYIVGCGCLGPVILLLLLWLASQLTS